MFMLLTYLASCLIAIYISLKLFWWYWVSSYNLLDYPSSPNIPIFGASLYLKPSPRLLYVQFHEYTQKYGSSFCIWLGLQPALFTSTVEFTETILKSKKNLTKSSIYDFAYPWLKRGLLTSTGAKWKKRRHILTPSFHFAILKDFNSIFDEQATILVNKLRRHADTGKAIDVQTPFSFATLSVIAETSMGVKLKEQNSEESEYIKSISLLSKELQIRQMQPWLWNDFIYRTFPAGKRFYKALAVAHKYTQNIINQRIEERLKNGSEPTHNKKFFLDLLLDIFEKDEIDIEGIQEEVDTFMFAGHDTTASALGWALWELSKNEDTQRKLHEAIDDIEKQGGDIFEKSQSCKYLEYVLKEAMRLHPPGPLFGRTLEEDTVIDNHTFKKGTEIYILTITLHKNPKYWEKPSEFIPERFEEEACRNRNPFCYVPFSAGARNCIGQKFAMNEEKIMLYRLMSSFRLKPSNIPPFPTMDAILKASNGLWMEFYNR